MSSELRQRHAVEDATATLSSVSFNEKHESLKKHTHSKHHVPSVSRVDRYSIFLSLVLLTLLLITNRFYPELAHKFFQLQYEYVDSPGCYDIGLDDGCMIFTFIIVFCLVRSFLLEFVLKPIARTKFNIRSHKALQRFGEQGWSLIYYSFSWVFGFYLYYHSPYFFNIDHIYLNWPHDRLTGPFKTYYLFQIASWFHQIIVLNVEERRKDFWQMFAHHIITVALTTGSYYYYFTRIGNVILIIMDIVDVLLSSAKMLKYCGFSTLCDYMFVFFLFWWVMLRHIVYDYLTYQTWLRAKSLMATSECVPGIFQKRCWNPTVINVFLTLLGGLQIITCIWMYLIIRVLIKVIKGVGAEDVRSDDEDEDQND